MRLLTILLILALPFSLSAEDKWEWGSNTDLILEEVIEMEAHLHSWEREFGLAGTPAGETHRADEVGNGILSFQIDAGDEVWGSWVQVLGSSDTPFEVGKTYFDLDRVVITDNEKIATYYIQIAFGETAAGALTANTYTTVTYKPIVVNGKGYTLHIKSKRVTAGTKVWMRCVAVGINTATLDFIIGLHEYDE